MYVRTGGMAGDVYKRQVPLHTSPAGQKFGVFHGEDKYTTKESERLMRLPMFYGLSEQDMAYVVECLMDFKEW